MKKFKQICYISLFVLFIAIILTCLVLYWVNPQLLKNTFEYGKTILDHPLPIIGVSVGVFCFTILEIFSHTSIGKSIYLKAKNENEETLAKARELEKKAEEYYKNAEELKNDTIAVLNDFSTKHKDLLNKLIKVCETSPNAKVQALAKDFKTCSYTDEVDLDSFVEEFKKEHDYKEQKTIEDLIEQINELREKINKAEQEYENRK